MRFLLVVFIVEDLFEDGTVSFLGIASIRHGFKTLSSLTVSAISRYAEEHLYIYIIKRFVPTEFLAAQI